MERKPRAYKISDEIYLKAMKKAEKQGEKLATLIEAFVNSYVVGALNVTSAQPAKEKPATKPVKAKELKPEVIGKPYSPMDNPIFRSKNKLK